MIEINTLALQPEPRFCETIQRTPNCPVHRDHYRSHRVTCREPQAEIPRISRLTDCCSDTHGRNRLPFDVDILGNDACVPCSTAPRDQPGYELRKDAGKDQIAPF